jgi:ABC-type spermidine/putrescine transport system permease subunit I
VANLEQAQMTETLRGAVPPKKSPPARPSTSPSQQPSSSSRRERFARRRTRWLWPSLAAPASLWLLALFVLPFFVVLAVAAGTVNPIFQSPVPVWNPLKWSNVNFVQAWHDLVGPGAYIGGPLVRTVVYTAIASLLSLVIAYPVAYFVTRFSGRRKTLFLVLLVAPFWVSYMMRMLAWIDLLSPGGYVDRVLVDLHITAHPVDWLAGQASTVVLGLVYGYIPYLIIVLYAGLDRIDSRLLEASRDLGFGKVRTFLHVTLPLSRQTILAGMFITALPMLGDYFTNQLLSATPNTTMIGNVIESQLETASQQGEGAALSLMFFVVLLIPMIYYVVSTARASKANA